MPGSRERTPASNACEHCGFTSARLASVECVDRQTDRPVIVALCDRCLERSERRVTWQRRWTPVEIGKASA